MNEPNMYDKMLARGVPMGWYKGKHAPLKIKPEHMKGDYSINIDLENSLPMTEEQLEDRQELEDIFDGAQILLTCNRCNQLYDKAKKDEHVCFKKSIGK